MSRRKMNKKQNDANETFEEFNQKRKRMNRQSIMTTLFFSFIFLFMGGYYMYFILYDAPKIVSSSKNPRIEEQAKTVIRGTIYANNGKALAYTDINNTENQLEDDVRKYPYGQKFAQIIGYTTKGNTGLEDICNYTLVSSENDALKQIENDFTNRVVRGCNVHTTLDISLQEAAYNALGGYKGGIFVMDPDTGAVKASVSKPSYNPEDLEQKWEALNQRSDAVFMNRSTQGQYMPGSVFKIVTTLAYMRQNQKYNQFSFQCLGTTPFDGFRMQCYHKTAHGRENLEKAFAVSCNGAFATMGLATGVDIFNKTANDLYFNQTLPLEDLQSASSSYVKSGVFSLDTKSEKYNRYYVAETSIGQQDVLVSPAQMAMIASAIAKDGVLMKPYCVESVKTNDGKVVREAGCEACNRLMTEGEAGTLQKYMSAVCQYGTASIFSRSQYDTYGKTGTADLHAKGNGNVNSWFVGYAQKKGKRLAIAVVLENIPDGVTSAKNCAKAVFDSFFIK